MMKKKAFHKIHLIISLMILYSSCSSQKIPKQFSAQGAVTYHWIAEFINTNQQVKDYTFKIWYLDSAVIMEFVRDEFDFDEKKTATLNVWKYVYLDLTNLLCQSYSKFDTTALVEKNFKLKSEETLQWRFYLSKDNKRQIITDDRQFFFYRILQ